MGLQHTDLVRRVNTLLERAYGRPEWTQKHGPLDELILTILSQNTAAANYNRAFANLRSRFGSWEAVRLAHTREVEDAIRVGGLANIKAARIRHVLDEILARHGELSLDFLAGMPDEDARAYLMEFEGVGIKTASCVLLFSLGRPVLPVDTHVYRVARRLGLVSLSVTVEAAHRDLQAMVPDESVYSFHVNMVAHGRRVCKARNPMCEDCVLLPLCPYGRKTSAAGGA